MWPLREGVGGVSAGRQLGFIIVALLASFCGGADRVAVDDLPVPAGLNGGCSRELLAALKQPSDLIPLSVLRQKRLIVCTLPLNRIIA